MAKPYKRLYTQERIEIFIDYESHLYICNVTQYSHNFQKIDSFSTSSTN